MKKTNNILVILAMTSSCTSYRYTSSHIDNFEFPKTSYHHPALVTAGVSSNFKADISPNGAYILYTSDKKGNKDIWEKKVSKGKSKQLTFHSADDLGGVFSPKGDRFAFISRRFDAAGDLHIMKINNNDFSAEVEGETFGFPLSESEDAEPAWFPDGNKIVFVSRNQGSDTYFLTIADLKSRKTKRLKDLRGKSPTVSPNGDSIAFANNGNIYLYNYTTTKLRQITKSPYVKDGQPSFSQDSKTIYFIRYADDTNHDAKITGDDRATIWSVAIPDKDIPARQLSQKQLTSAKVSAHYPKPMGNFLYFTLQTGNSLDIFRLPIEGALSINPNNQETYPDPTNFSNQNDTAFTFRRLCNAFYQKIMSADLQECLVKSLFWHVAENHIQESQYIFQQMQESFPDNQGLLSTGKLLLIKLKIHDSTYPVLKRDITEDQLTKLEKTLSIAQDITKKYSYEKATEKILIAIAGIIEAQIQASRRDYFKALETLDYARNIDGIPPFISSSIMLLSSDLIAEVSDKETTIKKLADVITKNPRQRYICLKASRMITQLLTANIEDPIESLNQAKDKYRDMPWLPETLHRSIVDHYLTRKKFTVAANELREMIHDYPENKAVLESSTTQLVSLVPDAGTSHLENELLEVIKNFGHREPRLRKLTEISIKKYFVRKIEHHLGTKEYNRAKKIIGKLLTQEPLDLTANRALIDIDYIENTLSNKIAELEKLTNQHPNIYQYSYLLAYAKTYLLNDTEDYSQKLSILSRVEDLLEDAKDRGARDPLVHQTFGWTQYQSYIWTKKRQGAGGTIQYLRSKFNLISDYIGFSEPNRLELAIDAYLISFYLSEEDSLQKQQISRNLAEAYYEIKNYRKALKFYVKRLKSRKTFPFRSHIELAIISHKAGKAAYQIKELALAYQLFNTSEKSWQKVGNTPEITRNLDYQALTLFEAGNLNLAKNTYLRLCENYKRQSDTVNHAICLINLSQVHIKNNDYDQALPVIKKAKKTLNLIKDKLTPPASDAIEWPLAGEASEAKGFTKLTRLIQIQTLLDKIYDKKQEHNNRISALTEKIALQLEKRAEFNGVGGADLYYVPELAVSHNNLGDLQYSISDYLSAKSSYKAAIEYSRLLRPEGSVEPTKGEWLNMTNYCRVQLKLAQSQLVTKKEIGPIIQEIIQFLGPPLPSNTKNSSKDKKQSYVRLRPILEELQNLADDNDTINLKDSIKISSTLESNPSLLKSNILASNLSDNLSLPKEISKSFRKSNIDQPRLLWRYFLIKKMYSASYKELEKILQDDHQDIDFDINSIADLNLADRLLEKVLDEEVDVKVSKYRRLINHRNIRTAMSVLAEVPESFAKISTILKPHSLDEISESLQDNRCSLTIQKTKNTGFMIFFQFGSTVKSHTWNNLDLKSLKQDADDAECSHIYITSSGSTINKPWNKIFSQPYSYIISPNTLPHIMESETVSLYSVLELGKSSTLKYTNHDIQEYRQFNTGMKSAANANIISYSAPIFINVPTPGATYLPRFHEGRLSQTGLKSLFNRDLDRANLVTFLDSRFLENDINNQDRSIGLNLIHLATMASGSVTTVFSQEQKEQEFWKETFNAKAKSTLVKKLLKHNTLVFGAVGLNEETLYSNAKETINTLEEEDDYREALQYARILEDNEQITEFLESIRDESQDDGDWESAYLTQLKLIDRLSEKSTSEHADLEIIAGILAQKKESYLQAIAHFEKARSIYAEDEDLAELALANKYLAITYESNKQYKKSLYFYNEARKNLLEDDDLEQAARLLHSIGNIYNLRLNDYLGALKFYNQALEELQTSDDKNITINIRIDRSNTLIVIGRIQEAISSLRKIILAMSQDKNMDSGSWSRAAIILANAYYRSGQYQTSKILLKDIRSRIHLIPNERKREIISLDSTNLEAMVQAKLGNFNTAIKIFELGIDKSKKSDLLSSQEKQSKIAQRLNNLGFWFREYGQLGKSIEYLERALEIDKELKMPVAVAFDLRNLGISLTLQGDLDRAEAYLRESLSASLKSNLSYNAAYCEFGLGDIMLRRYKWQEAEGHFQNALSISIKGHLLDFKWRALNGTAVAHLKRNDLLQAKKYFRQAIHVIEAQRPGLKRSPSNTGLQSDQSIEEVYENLITLLMKEGKYSQAWSINRRAKSRLLVDSLANQIPSFKNQEIQNIIAKDLRFRRQISTKTETKNLEVISRTYTEFQDNIRQESPLLAELIYPPKNWHQFQDISEEAVLIDYFVAKSSTFIWTVDSQGVAGFIVDARKKDLYYLVQNLNELLEKFSTTRFIGREISKFLITPILEKIRNKKKLYIVPHSILHRLSFSMLPFNREETYLVNNFSITYFDAFPNRKISKRGYVKNPKILAASISQVSNGPKLAFVNKETEVIKRYFPTTTILRDKQFEKSSFKFKDGKYDIIHIAAHAKYDDKDPLETYIQLSNKDSRIGVSDIFNFNLKTDLIIFSACESDLGRISEGDEIVGLSFAAMFAGSRSVIGTLWRINDVSSAMVMKRFYRYLSEGHQMADALQKAQKVVKKYFPHPAYWAAYKLNSRSL